MNPLSNSPDPLLQSLAEEVGHLAETSASRARHYRQAESHRRRMLLGLAGLVLLGLAAWQAFPFHGGGGEASLPRVIASPAHPPTSASGAEFVIAQTDDRALKRPLPLPENLSVEQKELLVAAQGFPLLLV